MYLLPVRATLHGQGNITHELFVAGVIKLDSIWQGERVTLRAMVPADWEHCHRWDQDTDIQRLCDTTYFPRSPEAARAWAQEAATRTSVNDQFRWMIETTHGEVVGTINTHSCDRRNGTFRYGLAIAREHQRRGYGRDAVALVLHYYFCELRYQKVNVAVYSFNEPSMRLHEHLGFLLEGQLRRTIYTQGQFFDDILYGMTAEEYFARNPVQHYNQLQDKG